MNYLYANSDAEQTELHPPMDVMAVAHLTRFVEAFPAATYQEVEAHVADRFSWALLVPDLQARIVELILRRSGQTAA